MKRSGTLKLTGLLLLLTLLVSACSSQPSSTTPRRLSIVTGGTSGVYYVYGGALAQLLTKTIKGVDATAEVSAASVENLNLLDQKSADIAFTLADTAYDAAKGQGKFTKALPLQTLGVIYGNVTHVVTMADSPINSIKDLKGKKVSTGQPNSGTEVIAERLLTAAGIDPTKDITRERLSVGESAAALKDKKIDAFFWSGGLPTAGVMELASTPNIKIKMISHADLVGTLVEKYGPLYVAQTVPANTYANTPEAQVSAVPNLLVVHKEMDADLAYQITKALFEGKAELAKVHPAANELNPAMAAIGAPMEYHPGAIKYFKEKGVWKGK